MKKIKETIKKFYLKYKTKLKNLWSKYITEPKLKLAEKKKEELALKNLHKSFEKKVGVSTDEIKRIINVVEKNDPKLGNDNSDFLNQQLLQARKEISTYNNTRPSYYDPEVVLNHNQNLNLEGKTYDEVKQEHSYEGKKMIQEQADKIRRNNLPDAQKEKLKNILRAR